jgi:hypothetical protein
MTWGPIRENYSKTLGKRKRYGDGQEGKMTGGPKLSLKLWARGKDMEMGKRKRYRDGQEEKIWRWARGKEMEMGKRKR